MGSRSTPLSKRSAGFRNPDWSAANANLRWLHGKSQELLDDASDRVMAPNTRAVAQREFAKDIHEAVHDLAQALGAPEGWLHGAQ